MGQPNSATPDSPSGGTAQDLGRPARAPVHHRPRWTRNHHEPIRPPPQHRPQQTRSHCERHRTRTDTDRHRPLNHHERHWTRTQRDRYRALAYHRFDRGGAHCELAGQVSGARHYPTSSDPASPVPASPAPAAKPYRVPFLPWLLTWFRAPPVPGRPRGRRRSPASRTPLPRTAHPTREPGGLGGTPGKGARHHARYPYHGRILSAPTPSATRPHRRGNGQQPAGGPAGRPLPSRPANGGFCLYHHGSVPAGAGADGSCAGGRPRAS
jgi:hypothetical protein